MNELGPHDWIDKILPSIFEGGGKAIGDAATKGLIAYGLLQLRKYPEKLLKRIQSRLESFLATWDEPNAWHKKKGGELPNPDESDVHSYDLWAAAVDSAVKTDSKDHHRVLRDLIHRHLCSESDDRLASSYRLACEAVGRITRGQLYLLTTIVRMYGMRKTTTFRSDTPKDEYFELLEAIFSPLLAGIGSVGLVDFYQLEATNCIIWSLQVGHHAVASRIPIVPHASWGVEPREYLQVPCWSRLEKIHEFGGNRSFATATGLILAATHSDIVLGSHTGLNLWSEGFEPV